MTSTAYISGETTLFLVGPGSFTEVPATFEYRTSDPYAISVTFPSSTVWLFGRELLRTGLERPTGTGDVRIWPARHSTSVFYLHLNAPSGKALMEGYQPFARAFLNRTDVLIQPGAEELLTGVDEELRELLGDGL